MIIQVKDITKTIGGNLLFEQLALKVKAGQKIGLIGRNGSGKSTLLKILIGVEGVDQGTISIGNHVTLGYLSQERVTAPNLTGKDFLLSAKTELLLIGQKLRQLEAQFADADSQTLEKLLLTYGKLQETFEEQGGYLIESTIEATCQGLGIQHLLMANVSDLSGGEQTLLALAKVIIEEPDVFLLDEPTNHLDVKGLNWLENYISKSKKTFLIVSHDRYFFNQTVTTIAELDYEVSYYHGNYSYYMAEKQKRLEILAKDYDEQQKEIKKIKDAIRRYRQWGNESDNAKFYKRAKELEHRLEKVNEISRPKKESVTLLAPFNVSQRSGKEVLAFADVTLGYGERLLVGQVNFNIYWQERIGILGNNGSGKSSLLKAILTEQGLLSGEIKRGSHVQIGYLAQGVKYDDPERTVLAEFRQNCQLHEEESRRVLAKYLFFKEDVFRQVKFLSGGEQVRLELAKLMQEANNLLLLDEPTNHLDIETRELLEEVLAQYHGTLLVVSHDRYFIEKIVTKSVSIADGKLLS